MIIIAIFLGYALLIFLVGKLIFEIIKKKKTKYLKTIRLFINYLIILFFCLGSFYSLALVVRVPSLITNSKQESLSNLSQWIINQELELALTGFCIIVFIGFFGYLYQRKIQKVNSIKPLVHLTLINFLILMISLILIYDQVYYGLSIEVGYHFEYSFS